jgi:beta-glucosidase
MDSGEGFDRATLSLLGYQNKLLRAIKATGTPMVVIYIQGRPLEMNWAAVNSDALLMAWYPGQEGGSAIADVLFGDFNPAGRLPISIPRSVGQVPIYYNKLRPANHNYVEESGLPLYSFGYGLSYTDFEYSALEAQVESTGNVSVTVTVSNTGKMDGDEVAQIYMRDEMSSVVLPERQLVAFRRVHIPAGEKRVVSFDIARDEFGLIDKNMESVVEHGVITIMAGGSSAGATLTQQIML